MIAKLAVIRRLWVMCVAAMLASAPVSAWAFGTPTPTLAPPTPTPPPGGSSTPAGGGQSGGCPAANANRSCGGIAKLQLRWNAHDPYAVQILLSATHCGAPTRCAASPSTGLITTGPLTLSVTDSAGRTLSGAVTAPGINKGGCPGSDSYRDTTGRMRLIYGASTTVIGRVRAQVDEPSPGVMSPPMRFKLKDACGYTIEGTVSTCFLSQNATTARIKCL